MNFQQFIPNRIVQFRNAAFIVQVQLFKENFSGERIAVGVQAAGFDADDDVSAFDSFLTVEHPRLFHDADDRAAHVVFARLIKAGHLRRLTADQRAIIFRTRTRKTLDHFRENVRLQFPRAEIIQEEQRFRAQHRDVIHAMVHQVRANRVVLIHCEGDLELRAHAVHGRHQHRLAIFFDVQREQAAKSTDLAQYFAAMR